MHILRWIPILPALLAGLVLASCGGSSNGESPAAPAPLAGAPSAVVPQLVGHRMTDAHRLAGRAGFSIRWMGFAGKLANGRYIVPCVKVLRQAPAAGERRPRGGQIAVIEIACRVPQNKIHDAFH